jgi:HEAT repeat protein
MAGWFNEFNKSTVNRKTSILIVVLIVAVVGGIGWVVSRPSEPVYQGKRLSEWLPDYTSGKGDFTKADAAVVAAGTNAVPMLLRFMRAKDSALKLRLLALAQRQQLIKIQDSDADLRNMQGFFGFKALGDKGVVAVPELIKIYERSEPYSQSLIALLFTDFGPAASNAVPCLVRTLEDANSITLETSIPALGRIHAQPKLAVPALLKYINKRKPLAYYALNALGQFGADAKEAVPVLIGLLGDENSNNRYNAANSLRQIDPGAAAKAGVK